MDICGNKIAPQQIIAPNIIQRMNQEKNRRTLPSKSPLVNKLSQPFSYEIIKCEGKDAFSFFNDAFIFRKTSRYCMLGSVVAEFRPKPTGQQASNLQENVQYKDSKLNKYYAVYNNDRRYFTPAFLMGRDLRDYIQYPSYDHQKFKQKVRQSQKSMEDNLKGSQILIAKPSGHKCQICKSEFDDYSVHIRQQKHLQKFRQSLGWKYATEHVENFQKCRQLEKKKATTQKRNKNRESSRKTRVQQLVEQVSLHKDKFKTKPITKECHKKTTGKAGRLNGTSTTYVTIS